MKSPEKGAKNLIWVILPVIIYIFLLPFNVR